MTLVGFAKSWRARYFGAMMRVLIFALATAASLRAQIPPTHDAMEPPGTLVESRQTGGASADPLADLTARVVALTGSAPIDCGRFVERPQSPPPTTDDLENAIECGKAAAGVGRAFWFVIGGHGVESWTGEGLLASADGKLKHFSYDSWLRPFKTVACDKPRVNGGLLVGARITCELSPD